MSIQTIKSDNGKANEPATPEETVKDDRVCSYNHTHHEGVRLCPAQQHQQRQPRVEQHGPLRDGRHQVCVPCPIRLAP